MKNKMQLKDLDTKGNYVLIKNENYYLARTREDFTELIEQSGNVNYIGKDTSDKIEIEVLDKGIALGQIISPDYHDNATIDDNILIKTMFPTLNLSTDDGFIYNNHIKNSAFYVFYKNQNIGLFVPFAFELFVTSKDLTESEIQLIKHKLIDHQGYAEYSHYIGVTKEIQ